MCAGWRSRIDRGSGGNRGLGGRVSVLELSSGSSVACSIWAHQHSVSNRAREAYATGFYPCVHLCRRTAPSPYAIKSAESLASADGS